MSSVISKIILYDFNNDVVINSDGSVMDSIQLYDTLKLYYQDYKSWQFKIFTVSGQTLTAVDLSNAVSWQAAVNSVYATADTTPMCRSLNASIDSSSSSSGIITVLLDADTSTFLDALEADTNISTDGGINALWEIQGFDSTGQRIYYFHSLLTAKATLDPNGNTPGDPVSNYYTKAQIDLLLNDKLTAPISSSEGSMLVYSSSTWQVLNPGANGQVLAMTTSTLPGWINSGSSPVWGNITGDIANQTDLTSSLSTKVSTSTTVNGHALSSNVVVSASDVGNDTAQWNAEKLQGISISATAPTDGQILVYNSSSNLYIPATGGSGSASWGSISGTLSNQTDLQSALNAKVTTSVTVNGHALTGDISVTASDVGLGNVANIDTTNASNISSGSLPDSRLSSNVTLQGNTFNGNSQLVQTTSDGKLPILDGSNLTNISGSTTWGNISGTLSNQTDLNTALSDKVSTSTTVNGKALSSNVTLTTSDISSSYDARYVSDAQLTIINNTSGVNTGDETNATIKDKLGAASSSTDGYLTSTDWSTFNSKQSALGYTPIPNTRTVNSKALSSDITLTTSDIADSANKRYVTDAELVVLGNTSSTNTGDETKSTIDAKQGAASSTNNGYITSSDYINFTNKQNTFVGIDEATPVAVSIDYTTRVLTVTPTLGYFNYYTDGSGIVVKHTITGAVNFPAFTNTSGVWYFYFDNTGTAITTQTTWTDFSLIATIYRLLWNANTSTSITEAYECHQNTISASDHTWKHNYGSVWQSGFIIYHNADLSAIPSATGLNTCIGLSTGTNLDDNLSYTITNSTSGSEWQQDLGSTTPASLTISNGALFEVRYQNASSVQYSLTATRFPFDWNSSTNIPNYITSTGTRTPVSNGYYFVYFISSIQDKRNGKALKLISSSAQYSTITNARAVNWSDIQSIYNIFQDKEVRPLYRLIFEYKTTYDAAIKYTALREVQDIRQALVTQTTSSGSLPANSITFDNTGTGLTSLNVQNAITEVNTNTITATRLPTSGVTAGTYGSSTAVPIPTVDAYGRITAISTASISSGDGSGFNLLINGAFQVNQLVYLSGTATTSANQFTFDRWFIPTSGQSLTFAANKNGNTVTAPASGISQVIDGLNIEGGTYTLSWTGTATAKVNGTTVANGGTVSLTAATNAVVNFSGGTVYGAKLELGSTATTFQSPDVGFELIRCKRYLQPLADKGVNVVIGCGSNYSTTISLVHVTLPVEMRASPTLVISSAAHFQIVQGGDQIWATGAALADSDKKNVEISFTVASGLTAGYSTRCWQYNSAAYIYLTAELTS